jgi:putative FmdB family regulatory protein
MITYEYKCINCNQEFELKRNIRDYSPTVKCDCGSDSTRHYRSVPNVDTYFEGSYKAEASIAGN